MKTICFVMDSLAGGGFERRIVQLIRGLSMKKEKYKICILLPNGASTVYADDIKGCADCLFFTGNLGLVKKILLLKPDVIHCCSAVRSVMIDCCKVVMPFKYVVGFVADANRPRLFGKKHLGFALSFIFSDAIVSNSKAGIEAYRCPKRKSYVIYNGFDPNRFNEKIQDDLLEIRGRFKYVVTMVAVMRSDKDWYAFVDTAKKFERRKDIVFLAVGGAQTEKGERYYEKIRKYSEKLALRNVLFLGHRKDVMSIFNISDVSLLLSNKTQHQEGVSNSIMESMAAGTPVIATNAGGTPEIVENGETGYLVGENGDEVVKRLNDLLEDDAKLAIMADKCKDIIKERFLLTRMVTEYETLYNSILNKQ